MSIRITVGDVEKVVSCDSMGMTRKNNQMPKDQWVLLYMMAPKYEKLEASGNDLGPSKWAVSQIKELRKSLKSFFKIQGNPIQEWDRDFNRYSCNFELIPEDHGKY